MEREIFKRFKNRGWSITSAAIKGLMSVLNKEEDSSKVFDDVVSEISERMDKREATSSVISVELMEEVCASLSTDDVDIEVRKFKLIDAFSQPRITYDAFQKSYTLSDPPEYTLHGGIEVRANMYKERLHLAVQRALRAGFVQRGMGGKKMGGGAPKATAAAAEENEWEISTLESLLGDTGRSRTLIGILTQPEEGKWFLEDQTSSMWLDLNNVQYHSERLFTEGSIIVLRGCVSTKNQSRLSVDQMAMLDPESRSATLGAMDISDPFHPRMRPREILAKQEAEIEDKNVAIVIISDCCFANQVVCDNLRIVFTNYETQDTELLFVLLGCFTNKDFNSTGGREAAMAAFVAFGETLTDCPRLREESRFLLIPSAKDPGTKASWPRRPLPEELVKPLRKKIKKITLASNPCRVLFYNQEIVFFREDMLKKMQRHCLQLGKEKPESVFSRNNFQAGGSYNSQGQAMGQSQFGSPGGASQAEQGQGEEEEEEEALQDQLVDTVLSQAHLFPLPPTIKPIAWDLDYTMRLHPLPQLLVMADHAADYRHTKEGCTVINPGSFLADTSFVVYVPWDRSVEFSGLNG